MKVEKELNDKVIKFLKNLIKELEEDAEAFSIIHRPRELCYKAYLPYGTVQNIILDVSFNATSDNPEAIKIKLNNLVVEYPKGFGYKLHSALMEAYKLQLKLHRENQENVYNEELAEYLEHSGLLEDKEKTDE